MQAFMGSSDNSKKLSEIVGTVKSWIPRRLEPANMSRDFWMPDESCRVCYECDSRFTIFNRRHHCRLCGRVFCARCAGNSIPSLFTDQGRSIAHEDGDRIRVCNYCFKQWRQGEQGANNRGTEMILSSPELSPSISCNSGSSSGSDGCSTGSFQHVRHPMDQSSSQSEPIGSSEVTDDQVGCSRGIHYIDHGKIADDQCGPCSWSSDEDEDHPKSRPNFEANPVNTDESFFNVDNCKIDHNYVAGEQQSNESNTCPTCDSTLLPKNMETQGLDNATGLWGEANVAQDDAAPRPSPSSDLNDVCEPVDYENNCLIWLPPDAEDEEEDKEAFLSDDDDSADESESGEWGYLRSNSSGAGEFRNRYKSIEEHRKAMERAVDGHFKALITQLLQAENLNASDTHVESSWLDIVTRLSWEAATLLKPDTSTGGGMDPGGYVKVKCIACGHRNESKVVKGVVCKKNVAHRRMTSKIDKARLLLLGGALEYQRVPNHLSSVDTLLQQEMDHLKMTVAKIDVHHPNILLVEKSVSRYAQEYLLAKNISLVLNIKRPLLERIARCTGAQIVPSIDNLSTPRLGFCESFHVERFLEDLGTAGQGGKKLTKTMMFFEGCPRPLGCTILLRGASGNELKKVKRVVHYGVFAAYHLALETSFLADEGASLPELPLKCPIKVALPDKPSTFERSISVIPGYGVPHNETPQAPQHMIQSHDDLIPNTRQSSGVYSESNLQSCITKGSNAQIPNAETALLSSQQKQHSAVHNLELNTRDFSDIAGHNDNLEPINSFNSEAFNQRFRSSPADGNTPSAKFVCSELAPFGHQTVDHHTELGSSKEDFPSSQSDHQSILVSLSTRCVWKGIVCERAHLFRIKYYGNFDKPLGRFLRDDLFDQGRRCHSCEMPSEAHIHCYTHRQGSLTISVKKLPEISLPGEKEGKIWMWHRCLRCPRANGFPPATKRVVMSDAAWGLSFGKFLELSFSNHAAASRVACCGHSLHRDCLRFYGFGKMVACFRYAPIVVNSVHLPPPNLEFKHQNQEWIQKELEEVLSQIHSLFTELWEVVDRVSESQTNSTGMEVAESDQQVAELELMLQQEGKEFEEAFRHLHKKDLKCDQPEVDILEINRLRWKLLIYSYICDQRIRHLSRLKNQRSTSLILRDKSVDFYEKASELDVASRFSKGFSSWDSSLADLKRSITLNGVAHSRNKQLTGPSHNLKIHGYQNTVRRVLSEGQFPEMENASDDLDSTYIGKHQLAATSGHIAEDSTSPDSLLTDSSSLDRVISREASSLHSSPLPAEMLNDIENPSNWVKIPFSVLYELFNKNSSTSAKTLAKIYDYNPVYISSFRDLLQHNGARLLSPTGSTDTFVPIYDDEPTSNISYTLVSPDYHKFISEDLEKQKSFSESSASFSILDSINFLSLHSFDESASESLRGFGSAADESFSSSGSRSFSVLESLLPPDASHFRLSFSDDGKVKYTVTCYFAKQFEALRRTCRASELDFVRSLSRCKKWGAQGGKSNVFFAKTLDDRFIIKQVTKTELESFIKFALSYFKYLTESIETGCPTCLAKILGIYQVTSKNVKGGKDSRMDVLVMENLLFRREVTRIYDLKGSARSRYNPDSSGDNKVLLDQNLIESMPTSPIFVGTNAKRLLERAVWNDTSFLASIDVMDYSLLVGVDEEKHELVVGIIDFMRQYTWDKHLETWVKASGILGGPKNTSPTVISPKQYKRRFRKAMSAYFLMVPDEWPSSTTVLPNIAHSV